MFQMLIGISVIVYAIVVKVRDNRWKAGAVPITGQVVNFFQMPNRSRRGPAFYYYSTIRYNINGRPYEVTPLVPNQPANYQAGNSVQLYYNPTNPMDARLSRNANWATTFAMVIMIFVGVIFMMVGGFF